MKTTRSHFSGFAILTAAALLLVSLPAARAEKIYGLTTTGGLFTFDSGTPGTTTTPVPITGVTAGQALVGMDFRPATGDLYALSYAIGTGAAQLYLVNLTTAVASPIGGGITLAVGVTNSSFGFDFNPVVDRIRVVARSRQNYRLNPNDGSLAATDTDLTFAAGDVNAALTPNVVAAAYSNNVAGSTSTTLYGYEFNHDLLVTIGSVGGSPTSPNTGNVFTVGATNVPSDTPPTIELDISGATGIAYGNVDSGGSGNDRFYTFNLTTGAATDKGLIGAGIPVLDISVFPTDPVPSVPPATPLSIALITKKKVTTTKASYTIKGTTPIGADIAYVEVKIGSAKFKKARGTTSWSFKARLEPGKNKVTAQAASSTGAKSAPVKAVITRD